MTAVRSVWQETAAQPLPPAVAAWLLDEGSLTAHLQAVCGDGFRVHVLRHDWQVPAADECALLHLAADTQAIVREVLLCCHDTPWVYARSILPAALLEGRHAALRDFGARSLGAHLFGQPGIRRDAFRIARLPAAAVPAGLAPVGAVLWGRRSRFFLDGQPLLVAEVFLPAFRPWTESGA